ncbi:universal stress protein [Saccharopolyspora sp. TS4A08]|uniref:Universal stress protein n=1 Tax=Saccharopolyspora ipomoeae TaxID=3042027 RepID=A0ABT6PQL7_9PSEU|nr:universal stress protein [Saccharopolyspora sp. TS4A08]MDI2030253.1 universal stress protein [Saccharopolyspora sp. TS4A08]
MTAKQDLPVLVGLDGSEPSLAAAVWAATEADLRHARMRLMAVGNDSAQDEELRASLSNAAEHCREKCPQVEVVEAVEHGRPSEALVRSSAEACLLVVGSRGRGNLAEAVLGSVSTAVAMLARCPVAVIRERRTSFSVGPVVVGVDGSPASRSALRFAFDAATARQTDLVAILVWQPAHSGRSGRETLPGAVWFGLDDAQRELAAQLEEWRASHPEVLVRESVRFGHPVEELVSSASHAQLLVVGHKGAGGFERLLPGSVAHGVLHHAECPVVVVRPGQTT